MLVNAEQLSSITTRRKTLSCMTKMLAGLHLRFDFAVVNIIYIVGPDHRMQNVRYLAQPKATIGLGKKSDNGEPDGRAEEEEEVARTLACLLALAAKGRGEGSWWCRGGIYRTKRPDHASVRTSSRVQSTCGVRPPIFSTPVDCRHIFFFLYAVQTFFGSFERKNVRFFPRDFICFATANQPT